MTIVSEFLKSLNSSTVYSSEKGLKLLRYGNPSNRFDQSNDFHYNKPPINGKGTWASVYPHDPITHFPDARDGTKNLDLRNQTKLSSKTYANVEGDPFLNPVTFYWKHAIYSHIDKQGNYNNKGWIYYHNTAELAKVITDRSGRISQSVQHTIAVSQNVNYPDSDIRYFSNHEFEVYVPHE